MISQTTVTVTTMDGDTRDYAITPFAMIKAEEYLAARGQTMASRGYTTGVFAAYVTARHQGDTSDAFDQWTQNLAHVDVKDADDEDLDEDDAPATFH